MKKFFQSIRKHIPYIPLRFFGAVILLIVAFNTYFQGGTIMHAFNNYQETFTRNWEACEDKKKENASTQEITDCQYARKQRAKELREMPRSQRKGHLPEVIGNYFKYYF